MNGQLQQPSEQPSNQLDFFSEDESVPEPQEKAGIATNRPLNILVLDDDDINRKVIRDILETLGYQSQEAPSGQEALEVIRGGQIDYLFTDIDMPEMNGIEVSRAVRAIEDSESFPKAAEIIAVTANISDSTRLECKRAGMNGFLEKPVNAAMIKEQLLKSWKRIRASRAR